MSLTINTTPANISNSAAFNVTTSLVEDSTHVNLRVRADIYYEGVVKAVVEKPKGLAAFDFSDILKSLHTGDKITRGGSYAIHTGAVGSNLCTSIASYSGSWFNLDLAANVINQARIDAATAAYVNIATIAMTIGELYILYSPDYATSGVNNAYALLHNGGASPSYLYKNKGILLMPTVTGNISVLVGNENGEFNISGTFYLYKITTNRASVGQMLVPYFITFTEVYENSSGVTTTGTPVSTSLYRYVPAKGDGTAFTEFVLHDSACLFANKTIRNNVVKYFEDTSVSTYYSHYEYHVMFFTEYVDIELFKNDAGAGYASVSHEYCYEGWGALVLNSVVFNIGAYMKFKIEEHSTHTQISEELTVYRDTTVITERTVLEFDGLLGGKEYLAFEGLKDQEFVTVRNYCSGTKKNRKPLSFDGICRQKLETLFKDQANSEYLKSLLISERVKRLEASNATPTDVTVITDNVIINKGRELFTNQIDIEYEY